ncbi:MAG: M17 family peptidase N-terminal domain-containing protein [Myxococcota bacterium]
MEVRFVVPDLRRLDTLRAEALAVGVFEDERPVRGTLGLVDWRMCGAISRLLSSGRLRGEAGERLLLPARRRLPFEKLFLFGLGPRAAFGDGAFDAAVRDMFDTLTRAQIRAPVVALPGRTSAIVGPETAMERFLALGDQLDDHDEVTLIEDPEAQKVMVPLMEQAKRRARADEPAVS